MLKIKKFLVFTLLLCAIVILVVRCNDSRVRVQVWALVCSTYMSYGFLICKMGYDLPPGALIGMGSEDIFEKCYA